MTSTELIQAAAEARPDLVEKTATAIALLEKIEPEWADELVQEIKSVTEQGSEKVAAAGIDPKRFGLAVGATVAGGLGLAVASDLYDAARKGLTKGVNYRAIIRDNPDLKHYDPKLVRSSYDTLHRYAPEFTSDPHFGGQVLKSLVEMPENQYQLMRDLVGTRKNLVDATTKSSLRGDTSLGRLALKD